MALNLNNFIFFETDISALLAKYHEDSYKKNRRPGIYAIPEDSMNDDSNDADAYTNVNNDERNPGQNFQDKLAYALDDSQTDLEQKKDNQSNIVNSLAQGNELSSLQMSQEEQQRYAKEIEPLKKYFLLRKLSSLNYILTNNFLADNDLDILLKFGGKLSYNSLYQLAVNVINSLREKAASGELANPTNNDVTGEVRFKQNQQAPQMVPNQDMNNAQPNGGIQNQSQAI